jgi:hypothetical protein
MDVHVGQAKRFCNKRHIIASRCFLKSFDDSMPLGQELGERMVTARTLPTLVMLLGRAYPRLSSPYSRGVLIRTRISMSLILREASSGLQPVMSTLMWALW